MPITCQFKPDERLVVFTHVGIISDGEFLSRYAACFGDRDFDKSFDLLVDLRRTNSSARSTSVLGTMAEFMKEQYSDPALRPKAAVLAPDGLSFGLARMFEAFSEDVSLDFKVFRTADEALGWLGVSGDLLEEVGKSAV